MIPPGKCLQHKLDLYIKDSSSVLTEIPKKVRNGVLHRSTPFSISLQLFICPYIWGGNSLTPDHVEPYTRIFRIPMF